MSDYTDNKSEWDAIKTQTTENANTATIVGGAGENTADLIASASGWANYSDTAYTSVAPFTILADTDTVLPNNKGSVIDSQLPIDIATYYDAGVIKGFDGDSMEILIEFKVKPTSAAATYVEVWLNIGGVFTELFKRITGFPKGTGVERPISFTTLAFNGATWEANGATVYVRSNGPLELYDIRYIVSRTHKAI